MEKKYVFLLCPILKDGKDITGNYYDKVGSVIQSKIFVRDGNIDTGLYGILWGKCSRYPYKKMLERKWAVVKTEINDNLLLLDKITNESKFRRGMVLYVGEINSCAEYILKIKDDKQHYFIDEVKTLKEEQIIGTELWKKKLNR